MKQELISRLHGFTASRLHSSLFVLIICASLSISAQNLIQLPYENCYPEVALPGDAWMEVECVRVTMTPNLLVLLITAGQVEGL
jgi:hypothetical protein